MSWFGVSLNDIKGQLTSFTNEVLSEGLEGVEGDWLATPSFSAGVAGRGGALDSSRAWRGGAGRDIGVTCLGGARDWRVWSGCSWPVSSPRPRLGWGARHYRRLPCVSCL